MWRRLKGIVAGGLLCFAWLQAGAEGKPDDSPTRVTLGLADSGGTVHVVPYRVYQAGGESYGQPMLTPADIRDAGGLAQGIATAPSPVGQWFRQKLGADGRELPKDAAALAQALNTIIVSGDLLDPATSALFKPQESARQLLERVARQDPAMDEKARAALSRQLLDDGLPRFIVRSRPVGSGGEAHAWVDTRAGEYWLVPDDYPDHAQRVNVGKGVSLESEFSVDDSLWLNVAVEEGKPPVRLLFYLRPRSDRQEALRGLADYAGRPAQPRPGAKPEAIQAALQLARQAYRAYPDCVKVPDTADDPAKKKLWLRRWLGSAYSARILTAQGEAVDARLMAESRNRDDWERLDAARNIAELESRLGRLSSGELMARATGRDAAWNAPAWAALREYGLSGGEAVLRARIRRSIHEGDNPYFASVLLESLRDDGSAETLQIARDLFTESTKPARLENGLETTAETVILHLLAYGEPADWKRISALPPSAIGGWNLVRLSLFSSDPRQVTSVLAPSFSGEALAQLGPKYRMLPGQPAVAEAIEGAIYQRFLPVPDAQLEAQKIESLSQINTYRILTSWYRPTGAAAKAAFNHRISSDDAYWAPPLWLKGEVLDHLFTGDINSPWTFLLEYVPPDELAADLEQRGGEKALPEAPLVAAALRVSTRAFANTPDPGRRSFLLAEETADRSGSVAGTLRFHPRLDGGTLVVDVEPRVIGYYHTGGFLNDCEWDYRHRPFVINGGAAMIATPRLSRAGHEYALALRQVADNGTLQFVPETPVPDADGTLLEFDLTYVDRRYPVVVALHATPEAGLARAAAQQLPALRKTGGTALASALTTLGRKDEAVAAWRHALPADNSSAVLSAVLQLGRAGWHAEAAAVLSQAVPPGAMTAPLWRQLAGDCLQAGDIPGVIQALARLEQTGAIDAAGRCSLAECHLLTGNAAAATATLDRVDDPDQALRVQELRVLAGYLAGDNAAALKARREQLLALDRQNGGGEDTGRFSHFSQRVVTPTGVLAGDDGAAGVVESEDFSTLCRAHCFAGVAAMLAGDKAAATTHFRGAVATKRTTQFEYRLAARELAHIH